jgi:hypothetical protein
MAKCVIFWLSLAEKKLRMMRVKLAYRSASTALPAAWATAMWKAISPHFFFLLALYVKRKNPNSGFNPNCTLSDNSLGVSSRLLICKINAIRNRRISTKKKLNA